MLALFFINVRVKVLTFNFFEIIMTKVLVFAPHPDDDIIGCGGTLINHIKEGHHISIIYFTSGEAGSNLIPAEKLKEVREKEARYSTSFLGIQDLMFLHFPDSFLESTIEIILKITHIIREKKPDMVYFPHKNDAHYDHKATYKIVTEALSRAAAPINVESDLPPWEVKTALCYEIWTPLQTINLVNNITHCIDEKITALEKHVSQVKHLDFSDAVKGLNRYRGFTSGKGTYCECFFIEKIDRCF